MKSIFLKFVVGLFFVGFAQAAEQGPVEVVNRVDLRTLCYMGLRTPQGYYPGDCSREVNFLHKLSTDTNWVVAECRPVVGQECKQFEGWQGGNYQYADKILFTKVLVQKQP